MLILDFVNQQKNANTDYLSVTIAEALIDPLKRTGKFEILPRGGSTPLTNPAGTQGAAKINRDGDKTRSLSGVEATATFNEAEAIQIGEAAGADVVVIGNFVAIEPTVQIQAKAVDVAEKRLALSKSRTTKLDAKIFDNINALAADMSREMAEKLPPLAQRVVYRDASIQPSAYSASSDFIASDFIFHGIANSSLTWGFESKYLATGLGGSFNTSFQFLHRFVQPYFAAAFGFASGKTQVMRMSQFDFSAGFTYAFSPVPRHSPAGHSGEAPFLSGLEIRPYVTGGAATGVIDVGYAIRYMVPTVSGGVIADFFIHKNLSIALQVQQQLLFDADTTLKLFSAGLGVGYRL